MRRHLIYIISLKYLLTYLILMYILVKLSTLEIARKYSFVEPKFS